MIINGLAFSVLVQLYEPEQGDVQYGQCGQPENKGITQQVNIGKDVFSFIS